MLAEYKKRANIGIGLGILANAIWLFLLLGGNIGFSSLFLLGAPFLFIWGLWSYAKGKGYHGAWGFLGLLGLIGLIILACFPDRNK